MSRFSKWTRWAMAAALLWCAACGEGDEITIPTVYLVAGRVADPTTDPFTGIAGATVRVVTAPQVASVTTDAEGNFILNGLPPGTHRLRVELPGYRPTLTLGIDVADNVDDLGVPLFTDAQIDSILTARGAPAWDRGTALFGAFALRSNGLPLGNAVLSLYPLSPHALGTLVQTGTPEDPIVIVNSTPGSYVLTVENPGFFWDSPFETVLEPGTVTFGTPRARPNISGFVFADRSTGAPVGNATVNVERGATPTFDVTDFLGQFVLVGVRKDTYVLSFARSGFLSTLSWPELVEEDTTRTLVMFHADSLSTWAALAGHAAIDPSRGHIAVEARSAIGGEVTLGATVSVGGASIGKSVPQTSRAPAMLLDLLPGEYEVRLNLGSTEFIRRPGVVVRAGAVSFLRIDL